MINILPKEDKEYIKKEYMRRLATVSFLFFFFVVLFSSIALFSTFYLIFDQKKNYENRLVISKERAELRNVNETIALVHELNLRSRVFNTNEKETKNLSIAIDKIITSKSAEIDITNFLYEKKEKEDENEYDHTISVRGIASVRDELVKFMETLKKDDTFLSLESPASNFLKERDVEFVIFLKIK